MKFSDTNEKDLCSNCFKHKAVVSNITYQSFDKNFKFYPVCVDCFDIDGKQVRTHAERRVKLNNTFIKKLKPKEKLYSIGDSEMVGVRIYVQPSGSKKGYYTCSKFS